MKTHTGYLETFRGARHAMKGILEIEQLPPKLIEVYEAYLFPLPLPLVFFLTLDFPFPLLIFLDFVLVLGVGKVVGRLLVNPIGARGALPLPKVAPSGLVVGSLVGDGDGCRLGSKVGSVVG